MNLPYRVLPFWFDPRNNEEGDRVLVLADGFEYSTIVDRIYPKSAALMPTAIRWALGEIDLEKGPVFAADTMLRILGAHQVDVWDAAGQPPGEDEPW